jgi:ParB family chromosome partitioning protein
VSLNFGLETAILRTRSHSAGNLTMEPRRLGRGLQSLIASEPAAHDQNLVPVEHIVPNPNQPRSTFDEVAIDRLAESIQKNGLLQPIVVRRVGSKYEIIAGERRYRAGLRAGLKQVPIVVRDNVSEADMLELAMLENVQRVDLNPIEKARGYHKLMHTFKRTQEEIARSIGQDRVTISNTLRLLELAPDIQEAIQRGSITGGHARALLSVPDASRRRGLFERLLKEDLSVRQVEMIAAEQGAKQRPRASKRPGQPSWVREVEDRWRRRLGVRVSLNLTGQRARIVVHCGSLDELERVTDLAVGFQTSRGSSAVSELDAERST